MSDAWLYRWTAITFAVGFAICTVGVIFTLATGR